MSIPLGNMHLNKLRDIKKIKGEKFSFSRIGQADDDDSSEEEKEDPANADIVAFDIDSDIKNGRLALLYRGSKERP